MVLVLVLVLLLLPLVLTMMAGITSTERDDDANNLAMEVKDNDMVSACLWQDSGMITHAKNVISQKQISM